MSDFLGAALNPNESLLAGKYETVLRCIDIGQQKSADRGNRYAFMGAHSGMVSVYSGLFKTCAR